MTDLEHELKELLHAKADHLGTPAAAPQEVLRRGRRRQARTVAGSALAGIVALAVAIAAVGAVTRAPAPQPADTSKGAPYPERTTSIQGFTVTAPQGWTLQDLWPWSSVLTTSAQSCSFSGSGTPVGGSGSPVAQPSQDCTSTPQPVPGGVPVLSVSNFDPGTSSTLCGLGDRTPVDLPLTGVAYVVTALSHGQSADSLRQACPHADRIETALGGPIPYAVVSFVGAQASPSDAAWIRDWFHHVPIYDPAIVPSKVQPSALPGPGYVVEAGASWRLEATAPFGCDASACRAQAVLVGVSVDTTETATTVDLPVPGQPVVEASDPLVTWGTADGSVASIDAIGDSRTGPATLVWWPAGIQTVAPDVHDGWIWWAEVPYGRDASITGANGQTYLLSQTRPPIDLAGGRIPTTTAPDGTVTGTLNLFGRTWTFSDTKDGFLVSSGDSTINSMLNGGSTMFDVAGGTLMLAQEGPSVSFVKVKVDGGPTINGWWMPAEDELGHPGRVWVIPLPGTGTGVKIADDGFPPSATSWPVHAAPFPGGVVMGGGQDGVSWKLAYGDPPERCLQVAFVAGDTASDPARCLGVPEPGVASLDDVAGETSSLVVVIAPAGSHVTTAGQVVYPQCVDMPEGSGAYAGLNVCVAIVPVSAGDVTFRATDANGHLVPASPFTVRAEPGRLALIKTP
ncbi:MAG: hypothetical protein ACM3OO_03725 [Planctomycetaceae bacterium]